ncbi:MAG: hypothetical protein ACTSRP_09130 [Candidatus Helarchaeota archaeon]
MQQVLDEKRIYISNIVKNFDFIRQILYSIIPCYRKRNSIKKIGNVLKKIKAKKCYDSGGFGYLTGRLSESELDPDKTLKIYEELGYKQDDILLQLDLPPYYEMNKKMRLELITKNIGFYNYQRCKIKQIIPIIHGWEKDELEYNYSMVESHLYAICNNINLAIGSYFGTKRKVELEKILLHLSDAFNVLKDENIFVLGAGNPNISHTMFALGAAATDGCSWRIDAAFGRIYIPEKSAVSFYNGKRYTGRRIRKEDIEIIKEIHNYDDYPFADTDFYELLKLLKKRSVIRQYHNAYVLMIEEKIANSFSNNPEAYYKYLKKRFENYHNKNNIKILNFLYKRVKYNYVQNKLEIYIKEA